MACFGDGAMSQGDVSEAMVFAASFRAPVLFFCQNNHYAISEPVGVQTTVPLAHRPAGFGIPSLRVDGNDVLAVRAATRLASTPGEVLLGVLSGGAVALLLVLIGLVLPASVKVEGGSSAEETGAGSRPGLQGS